MDAPGKIEKANPARAKVRLLEERGTFKTYPVGTVFTVPYELMEPAPENGEKETVKITGGRPEIVPGETTFRSPYADGNPLWLVKSQRGRDTWLCEVQNEPFTHNGKTYASDYHPGGRS